MNRYDKYSKLLKEKNEFETKQRELHKKHKDIEEDKVIVEQNNMVKFLVNILIKLIKTAAIILLVVFATIGILTLVYPNIRVEFIEVVLQIRRELFLLIGV